MPKLSEPCQKQDLNIAKVAQACLVSEAKLIQVLRLFAKAIVSYVQQS